MGIWLVFLQHFSLSNRVEIPSPLFYYKGYGIFSLASTFFLTCITIFLTQQQKKNQQNPKVSLNCEVCCQRR